MAETQTQTYLYNITQTLGRKYHRYSIIKQHFNILPLLLKVFRQCLIIEHTISTEITKDGNVHYHMQVKSLLDNEKFKMLYKVLTRTLGFCDIVLCNTSASKDGWINYMKKETDRTLKMFHECAILFPNELPKTYKKTKPKKIDTTVPEEVYALCYKEIQKDEIFIYGNLIDEMQTESFKKFIQTQIYAFDNKATHKHTTEALDYGINKLTN
jgi:hypothetical protein